MAANPLANAKHSLYFWLGALLVAGVQVLVLHQLNPWPWAVLAADAILHNFTLGLLIFATLNTLAYFNPGKGQVLLLLLGPALLSFLWFGFCRWLLLSLLQESPFGLSFEDFQTWYFNTQVYRITVAYLVLVGATGFALLWYRLAQKEQQLIVENENSRLAREAELFKLRQQLQPHFLFNSLNSVVALIGSKSKEAQKMVQNLAQFFRSTVTHGDATLISVAQEFTHLKLYLQIEEKRFGHRLKVNLNLPNDCQAKKLPPLIVQPLLENALKFGLYGTTGAVQIDVEVQYQKSFVQIKINNPFDEDSALEKGTGFGLKSVNRRLYLIYGRTDLLRTHTENGRFTCHLKIPQSEV
jgi:sensor histidine kinase YesM